MKLRTLLVSAMIAVSSGAAHADCAFDNQTEVKILATGFEAWKAMTEAMAECGNVSAELSQEAQEKQAPGLAATPPLFQLAGTYNSGLVPLVDQGLVRPLDDLVAAHGQHLSANQLIKVNGQTMAIAMMVNAQHLMYREDILNDLGIAVPATYEEVLVAAQTIEEAGVVQYPLGGSWSTTWLEFVNMYLGYGGSFFDEDKMPTINNETGVAALETMKRLTAYMDPEYLVSDSTYVQQQFQQGKIAMANLWASRAGAMNNADESTVVGLVKFASAPSPVEGAIPASTLWWDGIVIAANISDEEAAAAFRVALEGMDAEMANANPDTAIWLIPGYSPGENAVGAAATAQNGAVPYPASSEMGLMQTAIQNNITDFLTDRADAAATLAAIESDYLVSAREAGLIE